MHEYGFDRHIDDADVAPHALLHLPQFHRLTSEAHHLHPARQPELHEVTHHAAVYQPQVLLRVQQHARAWLHEAHVTPLHVQETGATRL